jgi:acyl-coenzyme A synthetase/AMP-(fatty) acid ligase
MEKEICDWLAKKVVHYKQLRGGVVFVEKVPKTASGKVSCFVDYADDRFCDDN